MLSQSRGCCRCRCCCECLWCTQGHITSGGLALTRLSLTVSGIHQGVECQSKCPTKCPISRNVMVMFMRMSNGGKAFWTWNRDTNATNLHCPLMSIVHLRKHTSDFPTFGVGQVSWWSSRRFVQRKSVRWRQWEAAWRCFVANILTWWIECLWDLGWILTAFVRFHGSCTKNLYMETVHHGWKCLKHCSLAKV